MSRSSIPGVWSRESRVALRVAAVFTTLMNTGCGPCSEVVACTVAPRISITGQVVDTDTGVGVDGTRVSLVLPGGGPNDSVTTVADRDGAFDVAIAAPPGASADVIVAPPGAAPYRIRGLPCPASTARGSACSLGTITTRPGFAFFAALVYRPEFARAAGSLPVTFIRTSGSHFSGPHITGDQYVVTTGPDGRFPVFGDGATADGLDPVVGDLVVDLPAPFTQTVIHGLSIQPTNAYHATKQVFALGVGFSLGYYFLFFDSTTKAPVSGIAVSVTRTGGIHATRDTASVVSDAGGRASLEMTPLAEGTFNGTATIRVPGSSAPFTTAVSMAAYDADDQRLLASFLVGSGGHLTQLPPGTQNP